MPKITPCLWYDDKAEEAARFYCSVFKNSKVKRIDKYTEAGSKASGRPVGSVMSVLFELDGQEYLALNGGPIFKLTEAVSFMIYCKDQKEIDYYWDKLTSGGGSPGPCGWLKDKYGLSWQVVPVEFGKKALSDKAMAALMTMTKPDLAALDKAAKGGK